MHMQNGSCYQEIQCKQSQLVINYVDTVREEQISVNDKSLFLAAKDLIRQADGSNPGSVTDVVIHKVYCLSS